MKTVKVRIAVAVDPTGNWCANGRRSQNEDEAHGWCVDSLEPGEARYWVTAELPIPETPEVAGEVQEP